MFKSVGQKQFCDGNSGRTCTVYNNAAVFFLLSGNFESIDDTGKDNNGSSVLVIMKDRDVQKLF